MRTITRVHALRAVMTVAVIAASSLLVAQTQHPDFSGAYRFDSVLTPDGSRSPDVGPACDSRINITQTPTTIAIGGCGHAAIVLGGVALDGVHSLDGRERNVISPVGQAGGGSAIEETRSTAKWKGQNVIEIDMTRYVDGKKSHSSEYVFRLLNDGTLYVSFTSDVAHWTGLPDGYTGSVSVYKKSGPPASDAPEGRPSKDLLKILRKRVAKTG